MKHIKNYCCVAILLLFTAILINACKKEINPVSNSFREE